MILLKYLEFLGIIFLILIDLGGWRIGWSVDTFIIKPIPQTTCFLRLEFNALLSMEGESILRNGINSQICVSEEDVTYQKNKETIYQIISQIIIINEFILCCNYYVLTPCESFG